MADPRYLLGLRGEAAAARWLAGRGWYILEHRWRGGGAELDLVCRDPDGVLVAVEVKLRTSERAGTASESLGPRRVRWLRRSLAAYAAGDTAPASALRVDLVTLTRHGDAWRLAHQPSVDAW